MSLLNQFVIGLIKAGKGLFGLLENGKALTTLDEYQNNFGDSWKAIQADCSQAWPYLDEALTRFQDPAQADKLLKIHRELDETKIILVSVDFKLNRLPTSILHVRDLSCLSIVVAVSSISTGFRHNTVAD
ncbi:hypothetical protein L6452_30252 [Arctium lappa]|uniref:Uncharacterized protein n=1 Tax=Arctium lappa TaxID=4217 RepID=A0ACB8ZIE2_ARCLA|nr:hypothetical protein L6452_30252 [Arctium lappa]